MLAPEPLPCSCSGGSGRYAEGKLSAAAPACAELCNPSIDSDCTTLGKRLFVLVLSNEQDHASLNNGKVTKAKACEFMTCLFMHAEEADLHPLRCQLPHGAAARHIAAAVPASCCSSVAPAATAGALAEPAAAAAAGMR